MLDMKIKEMNIREQRYTGAKLSQFSKYILEKQLHIIQK